MDRDDNSGWKQQQDEQEQDHEYIKWSEAYDRETRILSMFPSYETTEEYKLGEKNV